MGRSISFFLFLLIMCSVPLLGQTTITVKLQDSNNILLTSGSLRYYDGSWKTATNNLDGTFSVTTTASSVKYEMTYNGGKQTKSGVSVTVNPVVFTTVTTTVALKNSGGTPLAGGTYRYYQYTWKNGGSANLPRELLPGSYKFEMTYNGGKQTYSGYSIALAASHEVLFTTVTTTVALKNSAGILLTGGTYRYYQYTWVNGGNANAPRELLPGTYKFEMTYNGGKKTKSGYSIPAAAAHEVLFTTVTTLVALKDSDGNPVSGGTYRYYQYTWKNGGAANLPRELLPGSYKFEMTHNGGKKTKSGYTIPVALSHEVLFTTVTTTIALKDCNGNALTGGTARYYQYTWINAGAANVSREMLPGSYKFEMTFHGGKQTKAGYALPADPAHEVLFTTTNVAFTYSGTVRYYQYTWTPYSNPKEMLPGNYKFQFDGTQIPLTIAGCNVGGNVHIFKTINSDGNPLPNIPIARNDYGNHYVSVGTTDANGQLFTTSLPNGTWKFRASKDKSMQYKTSAPAVITFQTAKFVVHVKKSDCTTDFAGIQTYYNDYSNHYIKMQSPADGKTDAGGKASIQLYPGNYRFKAYKDHTYKTGYLNVATAGATGTIMLNATKFIVHVKHTDGSDYAGIQTYFNDYSNHYIKMQSPADGKTAADGTASIQLFPGKYRFKAYKDHTYQTGYLDVPTSCSSGTIAFGTARYVVHVKKSDDSDYPGIQTYFNDYSNHYIKLQSPSTGITDAAGKASIELFPGTRRFKAYKDHTYNLEDLTIANSYVTKTVVFQTAQFKGVVKDCDNNTGIAGIKVSFNDYSNHYLTLGISDAAGEVSYQLFTGSDYKFRAYTNHTAQYKTINFVSGINTVEFNPTRICFSYPGTVKYNDYSNHWMTVPCGTYLFPGSYKFRFYSTGHPTYEKTIAVAGCAMTDAYFVIRFRDSFGTPIAGEEGFVRQGSNYISLGNTDANGEIFSSVSGTAGYYYFRMKYLGHKQTKQQNIATNQVVLFQTVAVKVKLVDSGNNPKLAEEFWYRDGNSVYQSLGTNISSATIEMLPLYYYFRAQLLGHKQTKQVNTNTTNPVVFQTNNVSVKLVDSGNNPKLAEELWYRDGNNVYQSLGTNISSAGIEMLPLYYYFRAQLLGHKQTKQVNTNTTNPVVFQTNNVMVKLVDSGNNPKLAEELWYRDGNSVYQSLGTNISSATIEMLPLYYYFRAQLLGHKQSKQVNTNTTNPVVFQTNNVMVKLVDSGNNPKLAEELWYRDGNSVYQSLGTNISSATIEMLPLYYYFRAQLLGHKQSKQVNTNATNPVVFATKNVTVELRQGGSLVPADEFFYRDGSSTYISMGSNTSQATLEMLPLYYYFRATKSGSTKYKQWNVNSNPIVLFNWDGSTVSKRILAEIPEKFELIGNYPNPFNPSTAIRYAVPEESHVYLAVYNLTGELVTELHDATVAAGIHEVTWNATNNPSGTYYLRLLSGGTVLQHSMQLVK